MIEPGADLNASMSDENAWATPVNVATQEGHAHLVLLLSEQGADLTGGIPNRAPPSALPRLHQTEMSLRSAAERLAPAWIASANGHLEVLRVLADRGADLSASRFAFLFTDEDRELFLHGQMRMQDHCGWAQVSFADTRGKFRAHSMRLHGCEITPAWIASMKGHVEVLRLLVEHGVDLNARPPNPRDTLTPAYLARVALISIHQSKS